MKKIKLLLVFTFVFVLTACAQQKKYLTYTIKDGESVKSIAKDLGIKPKEIMQLNPDLSKDPKPNTVIIIPNNNYSEVKDEKLSQEQLDSTVVTMKTHVVAQKESLFGIAKKYGVTVAQLKEANDLTGNNIAIGTVLVIPEIQIEDEMVLDSTLVYHEVVKDDTFYSLTRKYDITEEELYELNPLLELEGLDIGVLLIVGSVEEEERELILFKDEITNKKLKIALMLPYRLKSIDDASLQTKFKKQYSLLNVVTDFHMGALIAVDSLRSQGMEVELNVFDTENDTKKVNSILAEKGIEDYDAVIGPLFMKNAVQVAESVDIPVIAPVFSKTQKNISINNLIKVAPNKDILEASILSYIKQNYKGEKVTIAGDDSEATSNKITFLVKTLKALDSTQSISVIQPEDGYIKSKKFLKAIDTINKNNWVLLLGSDNVVTSEVVNNLGVMPLEKRNITLFGYEGKNSNYTDVSNLHLARLNFIYPKEDYLDDSKKNVKSFIAMYKRKNYAEPTNYATKGFDVTYDVLMRLSTSNSYDKVEKQGVSERTSVKFDYRKASRKSGVENVGIYILQYDEKMNLLILE